MKDNPVTKPLKINPSALAAIDAYQLPDTLGFGQTMGPVMYTARLRKGAWEQGELSAYGPLSIDPAAKVLHYAQTVFEGMKAYKVDQERPQLFRPELNWDRLVQSGERLNMPPVPEEIFMQGLEAVTAACADFIPSKSEQSLYLRPIFMGIDADLRVLGSTDFLFAVIASPSEPYLEAAMRVIIERRDTRAAKGGTGAAKAAGNYAGSLRAQARALAQDFDIALWLDPIERRFVEELSGMNVFFCRGDQILTPPLSDSILSGVVRRSILELAKDLGISIVEEPVAIEDVLGWITRGECTHAFACGTAAIVAPLGVIGEADGKRYELSSELHPNAAQLRAALLEIQEGRGHDPHGWMRDVPALVDFAR